MIGTKEKIKGCGPFINTKNTLNRIHLSRNPYYNISSPAKIDEIIIKVIKDEQTRFSKLQTGEIQLVQNGISREKIAKISQYNKLKHESQAALKTTYLGFNMMHPILKQKKIRKAIAHAINKESIIQYILKETKY